jgi:hypothetical protein
MSENKEKVKLKKIRYWKEKFPKLTKKILCFNAISLGSRRSGKTFLINDLLVRFLLNAFDIIIIICPKYSLYQYNDLIESYPKKILYRDYMDMKLINQIKEINSKVDKETLKMNTLIIYDDMSTNKLRYDNELSSLFTTGRHAQLSIIFLTQTPTYIDNSWKNNIDLYFIFKLRANRYKDYIYENILSEEIEIEGIEKEDIQKKIILGIYNKIISEPYHCLVLDMENGTIFKHVAS